MPRFPRPVDAASVRDARFAEVVRTYEAPVSRYLVRMVGDAELARDLAQDTFLSAYAAWPDPEPTRLGAWLYRIATNHALSHLRRRRVIRWVPFSQLARRAGRAGRDTDAETDVASLDRLMPSSAPPDDGIAEADVIETILGAMDARDRAALLLHAAGFSGAEIAAQLDASPGSVRTRLSRARAHFREQYSRLAVPERAVTSKAGTSARHLTLLRPVAPPSHDFTADEEATTLGSSDGPATPSPRRRPGGRSA